MARKPNPKATDSKSVAFTKEELESVAQQHLANYPTATKALATTDGNFWLDKDAHLAEIHAKEKELELYEFVRGETEVKDGE